MYKRQDAKAAIEEMMGRKVFGSAADKVVVEEFLTGIEASMLCFVDENSIVPMESAQDYKRIFDGDKGPNTGGMGTYSPSLVFTPELEEQIRETILEPTLKGLSLIHISDSEETSARSKRHMPKSSEE